MEEKVNHPGHYTNCSLECIDIMEIAFGKEYTTIWCLMTAYKYLHRYKYKNGLEDLKKAEWYLDRAYSNSLTKVDLRSDLDDKIVDMLDLTDMLKRKYKKESEE